MRRGDKYGFKDWDCIIVDDISPRANQHFKDMVYIGDQLTHVNGKEVKNISDVVQIVTDASEDGHADVSFRFIANNYRDNQYHADDTSWAKCWNTWRKAHDAIARIVCFPVVLFLIAFTGGTL